MTNWSRKRRRLDVPRSSTESGGVIDLTASAYITLTGDTFDSVCTLLAPIPGGFNDPSTADVILRLYEETPPIGAGSAPVLDTDSDSDRDYETCTESELYLHLHSSVLRRAKYFHSLLSNRSTGDVLEASATSKHQWLDLGVAPGTTIRSHMVVIRLLYTDEFGPVLDSFSSASSILPVAMKLLFLDCVKNCVRFLESEWFWTEEEQQRIIDIFPLLSDGYESESRIARVSPLKSEPSDEMIESLISTAFRSDSRVSAVKVFVWSLLSLFPTTELARRVMEKLFSRSLKEARDSVVDYSSSPDCWSNQITAANNCEQLLWLVERMIELRDVRFAVTEWSEQAKFASDLQRVFREDAWMRYVPDLANTVLKCTSKLVVSIAASPVLATPSERKQMVENWLPVLIVCKDNACPVLRFPHHDPKLYNLRALHLELKEAFVKILLMLTMMDAHELLQKCLELFSTHDSKGCAVLAKAFDTEFRRAAMPRPATGRPFFQLSGNGCW